MQRMSILQRFRRRTGPTGAGIVSCLVVGLAGSGFVGCRDSESAPVEAVDLPPVQASPAPGEDVAAGADDDPAAAAAPLPMRDAQRRVAMMSVYFHARFGEGDWMPTEMRPIPLDQAVRILRGDDTAFAAARRRRAIAKLYTSPMRERWRPQLEVLGAPLARLENRFHRLAIELPEGELSIGQVVTFLEGLIPAAPEECKRTFPKSEVNFDLFSSTTDAKLALTVERDLDSMRSVVDPQNWSTCGSTFWAASYLIDDLGTGPIDWKAYPAKLPSPPAPGTTWSSPFFEHVLIDWGALAVQFRVALAIDSKKNPLSHQFDYTLKRSIMSGLGPIEQEGGIKIDSGEIRATAATAAGPTSLAATKTFKVGGFGKQPIDFFANLWASIALEQMADETYEAVCCTP